jgi:hypothetical protein
MLSLSIVIFTARGDFYPSTLFPFEMGATVPAASDRENVELPDLPPLEVTRVSMQPRPGFSFLFLLQPLAQLVTSRLFPGNEGNIKYEYLNAKISEGMDGYESMSPDVGHRKIKTSLGSVVGFHVYPATHTPNEVVIFCHGNIRPSRYMNEFLEQLSGGRKRVVIARDFVGYDLSSRVPNEGGSLELAAIANDRAVYEWAVREYPDADIVAGGRSIGTMGWANLLSLPKVKGAFGIVPFADPAGVVTGLVLPRSLAWVPGLAAVLHALSGLACSQAFPIGCKSDDLPDIQTYGFSALRTIEALHNPHGKKVLLLKASDDELVPSTDAENLANKLRKRSIETEILILEGGHRALPGDSANRNAQIHLESFLSGP